MQDKLKKYEYKESHFPIETLVSCLNGCGQWGWQVVNIKLSDLKINGWDAVDVLLMREIPEAALLLAGGGGE